MYNDLDFITTCDVPGPSKEAVRAIVLYKTEPKPTDKVVDIGCGTGGFTCEFAPIVDETYSIDKNPEAIMITEKNLKNFNINSNVKLINDDGVNALKSIENIDIAIIGGSGQKLKEILKLVDKKLNSNGRIIITAILLDTKVEAINYLKDLGYNPQIMEINVSKGRVLDRGVMMMAENPIAIIYAKKR